jgi:hypothetical protein
MVENYHKNHRKKFYSLVGQAFKLVVQLLTKLKQALRTSTMTSYGTLPSSQTLPLLPSEHSCAPSTPSEYYLPDILCLSEQSGPANLM